VFHPEGRERKRKESAGKRVGMSTQKDVQTVPGAKHIRVVQIDVYYLHAKEIKA
jgi:hypothetical protein